MADVLKVKPSQKTKKRRKDKERDISANSANGH